MHVLLYDTFLCALLICVVFSFYYYFYALVFYSLYVLNSHSAKFYVCMYVCIYVLEGHMVD